MDDIQGSAGYHNSHNIQRKINTFFEALGGVLSELSLGTFWTIFPKVFFTIYLLVFFHDVWLVHGEIW